MKRDQPQVEDEVNVPDWLADEAVVLCVMVLVTVAVVPEAVFVTVKVADPTPPLICSSSVSLSSIMISIGILHIMRLSMRGPITSALPAKLWAFLPCRQVHSGKPTCRRAELAVTLNEEGC